jgi:hypothetical protein
MPFAFTNPLPFIRRLLAVALPLIPASAAAFPAPTTAAPADRTSAVLIRAAGNSESDADRLELLRLLAGHIATTNDTLPGLDQLITFVQRWNSLEERLEFFDQEIYHTRTLDLGVPPDSPLRPIADFYTARSLVNVCLQYSGIYPFPERRALYLGPARGQLEAAAAAFPQNRVIRMYLGEIIPAPPPRPAPPEAPTWAVAQREALEALTDIIEWWVEHRLRPDGQYGGGWGDDCELWRRWVAILYGLEHPRINEAQVFFSTSLLSQPHLAGGYHSELNDVEHSAEDLADALTPLMFLRPDDPETTRRVLRLVELAETLWTGRNERGFLQFKSTYFTDDFVDLTPARACDTLYHPRVLQPALLYWQRTGNPRIGRLVSEWMRAWVDAAAREERGKPAGILPPALHWPAGHSGGIGPNWWQPENFNDPIYDFPGPMGIFLPTLVLTAHQTGDRSYLEPLRTMAQARLDWLQAGQPDAPPGTRLWAAARLGALVPAIAKHRAATGDPSLDELLHADPGSLYSRFRLDGDLAPLTNALQGLAHGLRTNFPAYTTEVRYTDRLVAFPRIYQPGWMFPDGPPPPKNPSSGPAPSVDHLGLLYQTLTGDPGDPLYFPLSAVRWRTLPRDFAALVTDSSTEHFAARLFHFGETVRTFPAELSLLRPGVYHVTLSDYRSGEILHSAPLTISGSNHSLSLALPPARDCELRITRAP